MPPSSIRFVSRNFLLFCLCAFLPIQHNLAENEPAEPSKNCLWKVANPLGSIYLLGTLSLMKAEDYPLSHAIEAAYERCNTVFLEVDLGYLNGEEAAKQVSELGMYPDGKRLNENLSTVGRSIFLETLERLGLPEDHFQSLQPWLAAVTLLALNLERQGITKRYELDNYFYTKAQYDEKKIVPMESGEAQIQLLANMSPTQQEDFLKQTIVDIDITNEKITAIKAAWRAGDTKFLEATLLKSFRSYQSVQEKLLTNRNRAWLPTVENACNNQGQPALIVLSIHNLLGSDGLLELLRSRGFSLEQL